MGRHLPPFAAIRAFEAAARHLSFKAAAVELCVSTSAVSHQIRALEEFLGTKLFHRQNNEVTLTWTGKTYVGKLTYLLDNLEESTRFIRSKNETKLKVLSTPGFAARWLVPRLNRFQLVNETILRVSEGAPSTDFATNDADIVIYTACDDVPGLVIETLMAAGCYPVVSPSLKARERINRPEDLLRVTLIHADVMDGWADWFTAAGLGAPELPRGPTFSSCELIATAAESGHGVALGYDPIVGAAVRDGHLEKLFDIVTVPATIYSMAYQNWRRDDGRILAFRDWIIGEVEIEGDLATSTPAESHQ